MDHKEVLKRQNILGYFFIALSFTVLACIVVLIGEVFDFSSNESMQIAKLILKFTGLGLFVLFSLPFYIIFIIKYRKIKRIDKQDNK